jgi:DNA repair protein RecO (recombination protein O)
VSPADLAAGFALTGYFLERRALTPRDLALPEVRGRMLSQIRRAGESS